MRNSLPIVVLLRLACVVFAVHAGCVFDQTRHCPKDIIHGDVAIIGGGSSDTEAAIRLKEHGRGILVDEKNRLGEPTKTYHDPKAGKTLDCRLIAKHLMDVGRECIPHFDIVLTMLIQHTGKIRCVEFQKDRIVSNFPEPNPFNASAVINATPNCPYALPRFLAIYRLCQSGLSGNEGVTAGGGERWRRITPATAQTEMVQAVAQLRIPGLTENAPKNGRETIDVLGTKVADFMLHARAQLLVSTETIWKGVYQEMYAL